MRIYIRHAHKSYKNGKPLVQKNNVTSSKNQRYSYAHDPPLTHEGKKAAVQLAEELLRKYPVPTQIITSPYLRARETAAIMAGVIVKKYSPASIQILCQADLSEYLGNHSKYQLDVTPATARHNPPHPESFYRFRERIEQHYNSWQPSEEVTWVITHGIIINEILRPFHPKQQIPYLGYIVTQSPDKEPELFFDKKEDVQIC